LILSEEDGRVGQAREAMGHSGAGGGPRWSADGTVESGRRHGGTEGAAAAGEGARTARRRHGGTYAGDGGTREAGEAMRLWVTGRVGITASELRAEGVAGVDEVRWGADGVVGSGEQTARRRHGGTYTGDGGVHGAGEAGEAIRGVVSGRVWFRASKLRAEGVAGADEGARRGADVVVELGETRRHGGTYAGDWGANGAGEAGEAMERGVSG
jgi:hypothetical protein